MANYKKSFNFRSGVQVDTDNFVVNANGLVGIGTSIPRRVLDVHGTIRTSGLVTSKNLYVTGISTFDTDLDLNNGSLFVGDNIKLDANSGVITATAINIGERTVTNLVGYSTEAWIIDPVISGIYTSFNVAINGVANSKYGLLVGNDPQVFGNYGIGFDQNGNTFTSGIITATKFVGIVTAGSLTETISNDRFPSPIIKNLQGDVTGIADTARGLTGNPDLQVGVTTASRVVSTSSSVGFATVSDTFYANKVGIGSTTLPIEALEIRKDAGNARVEILSLDGSTSRIGIGQSSNVSSGSSIGLISYGGNPGALTFKNQGVGDVNMHLHTGPAGMGTGGYNWYHKANTNLMKLTYQGNLGINQANPTHRLHVGGGATFTSTAYFENADVKATITAKDSKINESLTVSGQSTFNGAISYGATISYNGNGAEFRVPNMTQSEVTGLSTSIGSILYNSDLNIFVGYANTGWQHLSIQA